jgi:signal peptidase I
MRVPADTAPSGLSAIWDNVKTIFWALLLAMVIRFAIAQPFRIPSGSMQPTLLVGDYIVVTKWSYGYSKFSLSPLNFGPPGRIFGSEPTRGDVLVFRPSGIEDKDFVKRLIGLPGDKIQVIDSVLHINGEPVKREHIGTRSFTDQFGRVEPVEQYVETLPNGVSYTTFDYSDTAGDHTQTYEVPEGHYMMMGDNRDNSADSRYEMGGFGFVPYDHLVGKAQFVFVSFDHTTSLIKPWTLLTGFRGDRFVHGVE